MIHTFHLEVDIHEHSHTHIQIITYKYTQTFPQMGSFNTTILLQPLTFDFIVIFFENPIFFLLSNFSTPKTTFVSIHPRPHHPQCKSDYEIQLFLQEVCVFPRAYSTLDLIPMTSRVFESEIRVQVKSCGCVIWALSYTWLARRQ